MRFVVYDEESLEAITIINLPLTDKDIWEGQRHWRVPVPDYFPIAGYGPNENMSEYHRIRTVDLRFELLRRGSHRYGEQKTWMCFTREAELAMLLEPDWLPGQQRAINQMEKYNEFLTNLLTEFIRR